MLPRLFTLLVLGGSLLAQSTADKPVIKCAPVCTNCPKQSFSIRAKDGTIFTLAVLQFSEYRWGVTGTHWYRGDPVIVEYNATCLQASHITYHKKQKTIEAWWGVRLEDSSGKEEHFDAVLFKIGDGTLTPIKLLNGKERSAF